MNNIDYTMIREYSATIASLAFTEIAKRVYKLEYPRNAHIIYSPYIQYHRHRGSLIPIASHICLSHTRSFLDKLCIRANYEDIIENTINDFCICGDNASIHPIIISAVTAYFVHFCLLWIEKCGLRADIDEVYQYFTQLQWELIFKLLDTFFAMQEDLMTIIEPEEFYPHLFDWVLNMNIS